MFRDVPHMQVFPGRRGSCHIWQKCAIQRTFFFPSNLQFLPCENFHGIFVSMTQPPHVGFHCLRLHNGSHSSVQHLDHNPQFFCIPPLKRVQQLFPNDTNFSPMKKTCSPRQEVENFGKNFVQCSPESQAPTRSACAGHVTKLVVGQKLVTKLVARGDTHHITSRHFLGRLVM